MVVFGSDGGVFACGVIGWSHGGGVGVCRLILKTVSVWGVIGESHGGWVSAVIGSCGGISARGVTAGLHGNRIPATATSQSTLDAPEAADVPSAPDDRAAVMSAQPQSVHPSLHVSQSARPQSARHSKMNLCYAENGTPHNPVFLWVQPEHLRGGNAMIPADWHPSQANLRRHFS